MVVIRFTDSDWSDENMQTETYWTRAMSTTGARWQALKQFSDKHGDTYKLYRDVMEDGVYPMMEARNV
jgi:hypothetical protein